MKYSVEYVTYKGEPVIEVLVDGRNWIETFRFDEHFMFGVYKARLVILCQDQILEFIRTNGKWPIIDDIVHVEGKKTGLTCAVTKQEGFKVHGAYIPKPYLELNFFNKSFGFGLEKAYALIQLRSTIGKFILKNGKIPEKGIIFTPHQSPTPFDEIEINI